jgi:hypothetical protein
MKDITANIIMYFFMFIVAAVFFVLAASVVGLFMGYGWGAAGLQAGAPILTGVLIVTAIISWALHTTTTTS